METSMEELSFVFADRVTVPGWLGIDVQTEVIAHLLEAKPDKILLISDEAVDALHGDYFAPLMERGAAPGETGSGALDAPLPTVEKINLPQGDASKSWNNLSMLVRWAFEVGATKKSLVVAFGGGALMNVVGLFASMLFRGTKLMYVPTTLLAMHDVTTSLKTSICYDGRKNNIGTFYAPQKILIDVSFCRTLSRSELFSGIGELAKNAALLGGKHADGFCAALSKGRVDGEHGGSGEEFTMDDKTLMDLLALGIEAKMSILLNDAYEKTSGMIFEYGHTVSHAIEKAYGDGVVPHGLGVTYGMLSSSYAAERMGYMTAEDRQQHDDMCWLLLKRWPLPEPKPKAELVMELAMRDSKRGITSEGPDEISDVLLRRMGDVIPTKTSMLSKFPSQYVLEWLIDMGFPGEPPQRPVAVGKEVTDADCRDLIETLGCEQALASSGFESLSVGFANVVAAADRCGQSLVIKRYTNLVFLRISPDAVGAVDLFAGEQGVGPKVLFSSHAGLVMERLPGRTLEEADMHRGDQAVIQPVAELLARLHGLPIPAACAGQPMLWRTVDKMMTVAALKPELLPAGIPALEEIQAAIGACKVALQRHSPKVVLAHGDFKPSNVVMHEGAVKFIDFELAGPSYRGFDLMKIFRTAAGASEADMKSFIGIYADRCGEGQSEEVVERLIAETKVFEPLTWLEAAVFFLVLPQFKPDEVSRWNALAVDRWVKYEQTKRCLFSS
eukprot:CAMPEP_0195084508 /NCGR_PEP_ID=MMETSP0448-20130528/25174_1 /TAXON_ID=66468 /ORGANISM="Heterocapsa triquestra, Strain CCMP 448" /LENGTH=726 /DNA_ID=CAMNT_0040117831 /DNA_START=41 /DNA_END=2221 /DNA_ORIENTATION=+